MRKSRRPIEVGDRFYKNYNVPNSLVYFTVTNVEDAQDDDGPYYLVTAKSENIAIGAKTKTFSSRYLLNGDFTIRQKGIDF